MRGRAVVLMLALLLLGCHVQPCTIPTAPKPDSHPENGHITVPLTDTDWLWA